MTLPPDFLERVYAGVLGKLIGVYLGRPFEGWRYDRILAELGEVTYYVHERRGVPLVVTDDDITGTFTFLRALADYPVGRALTPEQIGATWLNYIIENRSILWWGGVGNSTEHTAYVRLKHGIRPPDSGSCALNGRTVAEQIGAQIFIDGWGMIAPGDPELAVEFARKAACVSHDGEAIYGAQVIAALEAQAFVESDLNRLLDVAVSFIPQDSIIYRLITDLREWHSTIPDWRAAREKIAARYGYDQFPGNCHIVPNHALIHLGLLYGADDLQQSLMITNTAGWDTDCNSGNVGCILGIKNGLAGIDAGPDWRGPVADRLYLPTADGAGCISDAVQESVRIVNLGRALCGAAPITPKGGARFHFEAPGAVQGFESHSPGLRLENVNGHSASGARSLALRYQSLEPGAPVRAATPTFIRPDDLRMPGYDLHASPTLYPGQTVCARIAADEHNREPVTAALTLSVYCADDQSETILGPAATLAPGVAQELRWTAGETEGQPIYAIGVELRATHPATGVLYLDYLTWDGAPNAVFTRPARPGTAWQRAWVSGVDQFRRDLPEPFRPIQNEGRGLLIQGAREWRAYRVGADVKPLMCAAAGIASCVQGLRRYYALLLAPGGKLRLIKMLKHEQTLAEIDLAWALEHSYQLALETDGHRLRASVDGRLSFDVEDTDTPLLSGAIALVVQDGCSSTRGVSVRPLNA
jgi:ADP-ribosylglycohydrolase